VNLDEFKTCKSFNFSVNNPWDSLKIFQIIISKLKYKMYPAKLHYDIPNNIYSLMFSKYLNKESINISLPDRNDSLIINTSSTGVTQRLKFKTFTKEAHSQLNKFLYYRAYNNSIDFPISIITQEYISHISITDDDDDRYTIKINNVNQNYLQFVDIHNLNIMILLTWIFSSSDIGRYTFNVISKIKDKFNFLLDDTLLMNNKRPLIEFLYDICDILCYKNSKIHNHNIKIGPISFTINDDNINIKLHSFEIFSGPYSKILKFKYVDDIKFQLFIDYITCNTYHQKIEDGFNKYIFKHII